MIHFCLNSHAYKGHPIRCGKRPLAARKYHVGIRHPTPVLYTFRYGRGLNQNTIFDPSLDHGPMATLCTGRRKFVN